jgi:hypothetical protein
MREQYTREGEEHFGGLLAEVNNLNRLRGFDGRHAPATLEAVHVDLHTATMEAAIPYAVSTTHQEYRDGSFWWLDQDQEDVARSGYRFHSHQAALERVDVEVEEAASLTDLRPGYIKMLISPKMSRKDATYEEAKAEHLADDDMIRIHMLDIDESGAVRGKFMQSALMRDVPLEAWVAMLRDPNNIFGRSFELEDPDSALSVMKLHKQMELPEAALPEGVISLMTAVIPYADPLTRAELEARLDLYRFDQKGKAEKAKSVADRWLAFEVELADSLHYGRATSEIEGFIASLQHQWSDEMLAMLRMHQTYNSGTFVTPELAAKLEEAKRNTLWTAAAVVTGNENVLKQLDTNAALQIYDNEMRIQRMMREGYAIEEILATQVRNNVLIAQHNVRLEGGCAGRNVGGFGRKDDPDDNPLAFNPFREQQDISSQESESKAWKWENGVCRISQCPTRPAKTSVGPCAVCRGCQKLFDKGLDPSKIYHVSPQSAEPKLSHKGNIFVMETIFSTSSEQKNSTELAGVAN